MKRIISVLMLFCTVLGLCSCSKTDYDVRKIGAFTVEQTDEATDYIRIVMKNGDAMLIELYPSIAPITVENFKNLVSEHYYDGITFHRVIEGFMIQGGDPDGDGYSNGDRPAIKGEFSLNGVENNLQHKRGVISMARSTHPDSASTQFFIMHKTDARLDGQYAAFGMMLAGFDTLDKIASVKTDGNDKPQKDQIIAEIRFVKIISSDVIITG